MTLEKRKIIAIVGATATGKTGIGVRLAKEFDGEIISADSRQVYRGLDLGTGKDLKEYDGVRYHLIDIVDPGEKLTLFDYLPLARAAIEDIFSRGKLPVVVGGSGLYVQALIEGFALEGTEERSDRGTEGKLNREQLESKETKELVEFIKKIDPEKAKIVDQKNRHRLIRAIELAQEGMRPIKVKPGFEVLQVGVDIPRAELHERIDRRVDERFEQGMLEEVENLIKSGVSTDWLIGLGLEYREIAQFVLGGKYNVLGIEQKTHDTKYKSHNTEFELMKQQLKFKIHQFARRQLTWFRRFPEINWLSNYDEMKRFVKIFLEH